MESRIRFTRRPHVHTDHHHLQTAGTLEQAPSNLPVRAHGFSPVLPKYDALRVFSSLCTCRSSARVHRVSGMRAAKPTRSLQTASLLSYFGAALLLYAPLLANAQAFEQNGQFFTKGLAIIDAPAPNSCVIRKLVASLCLMRPLKSTAYWKQHCTCGRRKPLVPAH